MRTPPQSAPLTSVLLDLLPMLDRLRELDTTALVRLVIRPDVVTALAPLPIGVIAARTLRIPDTQEPPNDVTVGAAELAEVLRDVDVGLHLPPRRDAEWRVSSPPRSGWVRQAVVTDEQIRTAVRAAAAEVTSAPLAAAAEMALDTPAMPHHEHRVVAGLSRRGPSALIRMGFSPPGGQVLIDSAGRWVRLVAGYGSIYVGGGGAPGSGGPLLNLLR